MEERGELKPCPFCGKKARMSQLGNSSLYYIMCNNGSCKIRPTTWGYRDREKTIEAWNRRANDDTTRD